MTSRIYRIDLNGLDARITIAPTTQGARAYTVVFDDESSDIVAVTDSQHYIGFCDREIVYAEAGNTLATRRQIEYADINAALDALDLVCNCDDDNN